MITSQRHLETGPPDPRSELAVTRFVNIALLLALAILALATQVFAADTFTVSTAPGGMTLTGTSPSMAGSFGTMDALHIVTPTSGVTSVQGTNGTLYYTPILINTGNLTGHHHANISGYVSSNFGHPAALIMQGCPSAGSCTATTGYGNLSLVSGSPTTLATAIPELTSASTFYLAIWIPEVNGASGFSGTDTVTVGILGTDLEKGSALNSGVPILITFSNNTLIKAIRLTLTGTTITSASDYAVNFGTVNGLGVNPAAGFTTTTPTSGTGVVYQTSYQLNPVYSSQSAATATIKVYVSTNFAKSTLLRMVDASTLGGPFSTIGTSLATATTISTTAADRAVIARVLGLQVSAINGASTTGADSATLTYVMTVP